MSKPEWNQVQNTGRRFRKTIFYGVADHQNPKYALQVLDESILYAAARGDLDLNVLACVELINRGIGPGRQRLTTSGAYEQWKVFLEGGQ